jgi:hypothetical protein
MSIRAAHVMADQYIPTAIRAVFSDLDVLRFSGNELTTIENIQYYLALVDFNTHCGFVKASIQQGNATGREILQCKVLPSSRVKACSSS